MKYSLLSGGVILSLWQQLFIVFCGSAGSFQKFQKYHKSSWDTSLLSAIFFWVTTEASKKFYHAAIGIEFIQLLRSVWGVLLNDLNVMILHKRQKTGATATTSEPMKAFWCYSFI